MNGGAAISRNTAHGAAAAFGAAGGEADGGGLAVTDAQLTVNGGATIDLNSALAGAGDSGPPVVWLRAAASSPTAPVSWLSAIPPASPRSAGNTAFGGNAGFGATAGTATGGGITFLGGNIVLPSGLPLTLTNAIVESNTAHGGLAPSAGSGGNAEGGGLFVSNVNGTNSARILNSTFFDNVATRTERRVRRHRWHGPGRRSVRGVQHGERPQLDLRR